MTKKLLIYDAVPEAFVNQTWSAGAKMFASKFDRVIAGKSWDDIVAKLAASDVVYDEVQFWGHGSFGEIYVAGRTAPKKFWIELATHVKKSSYVWLRVCSFAATQSGKHEMVRLADQLDCTILANTFSIGQWGVQSGLKSVNSSHLPNWPDSEGWNGRTCIGSAPWRPETVTALQMSIPSWARLPR